MNSQNEVVAAGYLNKALYDLTTLVVGDGGKYFNADITRLYVTLADRLTELYAHNDVLSAIMPKALFQEYKTLLTYEADIVRDWSSLEADTEQHINAIRRYVADNRIDTTEAEKQTAQIVSEVEDIKFSYWSRNNITAGETVAYVMKYDQYARKLVVNNKVIASTRYDSFVDEALIRAFVMEGQSVTIKGKMSAWKNKIDGIPKDIKDLFLQTSAQTIRVNSIITQQMVEDYGINQAVLDEALAKLPALSDKE